MAMGKLNRMAVLSWVLIGVLSVIFSSIVQAQQPVDFIDHFYATVTLLSTSQELTIFHSDVKGIVRDNLENKKFDNLTSHCLRSARIAGGKMNYTTYSKFTDSDGDFFITETIADGVPAGVFEGNWKFIQGTGKWKGIMGGGISKTIFMTRGKQQINPTTFQGYLRMTGTFELPK